MDIEESALIEAAKSGDSEAFGVIVRRHMPRALAYARQMTGNSEDAQDLVQDAFVKAFRSIGSFKGESSFHTWFYRLLSNLCLDHLRRANFVKKVFFFAAPDDYDDDDEDIIAQAPDTYPGSTPDGGLEQKELRAALSKALRGLPSRQRAVFLLRHNEGMRLLEIASVLGISEGAVKSHLARAVGALQKSMKEYGGNG